MPPAKSVIRTHSYNHPASGPMVAQVAGVARTGLGAWNQRFSLEGGPIMRRIMADAPRKCVGRYAQFQRARAVTMAERPWPN